MPITFQYNKTSLQVLEKQLKMRERTLPVIQNKESALRMAVKQCKQELVDVERDFETNMSALSDLMALWSEFDSSIITIEDVEISTQKVAGVRIPSLDNVRLTAKPYSLFNSPKWYYEGIDLLQRLATIAIRREFVISKLQLLEHTRKKTTQKVNLFEKIQIPGYQDAIRKIKRFMEDEENLSKSSQKILKVIKDKKEEVS